LAGHEYTCFSTLSSKRGVRTFSSSFGGGEVRTTQQNKFSAPLNQNLFSRGGSYLAPPVSSYTLSLIPGGSEKGLADLKTAELALTKAIQEYKEPSTSSGSFRELANGVFQAEGCVSA